jgi:uncharacterized protein (DUF433 family)
MRQVVGRALWLGNAGDLRDAPAVLNAGIEAVVEVADSEPLADLPRDLIRCRFPLSDGGDNPAWLLRLAAEAVAALLRAGVPVLVCCSAGMSRSVCVTAAGVALAEGRPLAEAVAMATESGPVDVSPGLLVQMREAVGESRLPANMTTRYFEVTGGAIMGLPEFLNEQDGEVRLTGHRISLFDVLWFYREGQSAEMLIEQFPTLSMALIHKTLAYYWENKSELDVELDRTQQELDAAWATGNHVDVVALRARLAARATTSGAG